MSSIPEKIIFCIDSKEDDSRGYFELEDKSHALYIFSSAEDCQFDMENNKIQPDVLIYTVRGDASKGIDFLRQLHDNYPDIPKIFYTKHPGQPEIQEAILEGAISKVINHSRDKRPLRKAIDDIFKHTPHITFSSDTEGLNIANFQQSLLPHLSNALQLIGDALFVINQQGNIIHANRLGEAILGATWEQLEDQPFCNFLPMDPAIQKRWEEEYLTTEKSKSLETKVLHRKNAFRRVRLTVWPVLDEESGERFFNVLARDRTRNQLLQERQAFLEDALFQAQQFEASITMAGGLAHQFNNMLTPVFGLSELLCERDDLPEDVLPLLAEIKAGAERATDLVQSMLLSTKQASHAHQDVDVEKALWRSIKVIKSKASQKITVTHDIRGPLPSIKGDPEHIHLMLLNIGTNAIEAIADGYGDILIRAYFRKHASFPSAKNDDHTGPAIFIEITDNGPGIADDFLPSIFHPFQSTDTINHAGMGLAVVRGIIDKHHGFVDACSELGKGTSFYIYLPIDEEVAESFTDTFDPLHHRSTFSKAPKKAESGNVTVLLLDDHEHVLIAIRRMLESIGVQVDAFELPEEAIAAFQNNLDRYSAVLTDLKMPIMNGVDFAHAIRGMAPRIPIIMLTGYMDIREAIHEMPFDKLLAKPIIPSKLNEVLHQLIGDKLENLSHPSQFENSQALPSG
jgi:PAS domain S-box-containing protein